MDYLGCAPDTGSMQLTPHLRLAACSAPQKVSAPHGYTGSPHNQLHHGGAHEIKRRDTGFPSYAIGCWPGAANGFHRYAPRLFVEHAATSRASSDGEDVCVDTCPSSLFGRANTEGTCTARKRLSFRWPRSAPLTKNTGEVVLAPISCLLAAGLLIAWLSDHGAINVIKGKRDAQGGRVGDEASCDIGWDGLPLDLVMAHIALRATNGLGQGGLRQPETGSDGFDGVHDSIMSATFSGCQYSRCFYFLTAPVMIQR